MAWDSHFEIPPWMNPRETPFDTLQKGAAAGSMISRAMNERTELGMAIEKQSVMLPIQLQDAALRTESQQINLAEQQIGLQAVQQEVEYQRDDLSGFENYIKTLAQTTDPVDRASVPVPAFMSAKYNAQAEKINRNMQDTQAVRDAATAKHDYSLSVAKWQTQIFDEAAAVQPFLPAGSPPIITPNPKGGLPMVNQSLLNEGKRLQTEAKTKSSELNPVVLDGKTVGYSATNPSTGATTFHALPGGGKTVDPATDMKLRSLYHQIDADNEKLGRILSRPLKATDPKGIATEKGDNAAAIRALQGKIDKANDELQSVLSKSSQSKTAPPSKAQAMSKFVVGGIYKQGNGRVKYLGGDADDPASWEPQ